MLELIIKYNSDRWLLTRSIVFQHTRSLENLDLNEAQAELIRKKVSKINSTLLYCLSELGVWLALKVFI